jgi:hypothetical protein
MKADAWQDSDVILDESACPECGRENCGGHDEQPAPRPPRWQSAADAIQAPTLEPVVEGVAYADSTSVLVSESGAGKTFVLIDIAAEVSAGKTWHGRRVQQGSVVYVGYEGRVGRRLRALREVAGQQLEHVYVIHAADPLSPIVDRDRVELPSRGEIELTRDLDEIVAHGASNGLPPVVLLAIDTVRASLAGSEDASENVSAYLRTVTRLGTHVPGAARLLSHHTGWQDGETKRKRERGSSAFRGNVDCTVFLEAGEYDVGRGEARLTLTTLKVRDGEPPPPLHLVRRRVEIPGLVDRWGNAVTSCVVESDHRSREDREAEQTRTAEAEGRVLDIRTLKVIVERPDLATSLDKIRLALGLARPVAYESVSRTIRRGWTAPPAAQRQPYTVTPAGAAALAEEALC